LLRFRKVAAIAIGGIDRKSNLLDRDLRGELIQELVGINKYTIVLLFEAPVFLDNRYILGDQLGII
jgi:hypothetical protein